MRIKIIIPFLLCCVFSCNKKQEVQPHEKQNIYKDTVLTIDSLNFTDTKGSSTLTNEIAKQVLDEYYSAKCIYDYETDYQDDGGNQLCAYNDTLYRYNLNNDNHEDGIIAYHLMPCFASGHCYLPSYAIITKIKGKYRLVSAKFISNHCVLDTVTSDKKFNYIQFYSINCATDSVVGRYKSKIARN